MPTCNSGCHIFREDFDTEFFGLAPPHEHNCSSAVCHLARVTAGCCSIAPLRERRTDLSKSLRSCPGPSKVGPHLYSGLGGFEPHSPDSLVLGNNDFLS